MAEVTATGPRASFGVRLVAYVIDIVLFYVAFFVLVLILKGFGFLIAFVAFFGYWIYLEGSPSGQTVGKKVMNIRVVDADTGGPIGYGRAVVRLLGRIPSGFFALGYLWMLWDPNKQTWSDKFASSVVVPTADYPVEAWPG